MEHWFAGRTALVTGAGDGIGRAAALLFAARGAHVVVTDLRLDTAEQTAHAIARSGGTAVALSGDVTSEHAVANFVHAATAHFGRLDVAFNNAGITLAEDSDWDEAAARQTFEVNLFGMMRCLRLEIPAILAGGRGGAIVNNASLAGFIASRTVVQPAYAASKHAVIGLTKSAALQYARSGLRVNALCPGATATTMVRQVMESGPEVRRSLEELSPMGRLAQPEEMAAAAVWLCSEQASFINAHALVVDGGALAE